MKIRGFTLVELLIAMIFLSVALFAMIWMNSFSQRGSMDAYYEFLAFSLAREPIEVFRTFGYDWLSTYAQHPIPKYPLGRAEVTDGDGKDVYPFEENLFERDINLQPIESPHIGAIKVRVTVSPRDPGKAFQWLTRKKGVTLEAIVFENPK